MKPLRLPAARELALSQAVQNLALLSGIASSLFYVVMCIVTAAKYKGYSAFSQTVSELAAIGAPSSPLWNSLRVVYALLAMFSGWGLWMGAAGNQSLKTAGIAMFIYALAGAFWPPMHQREVLANGEASLTDGLHITVTFISVALMIIVMVLSAGAFGQIFRLYTIATIGVMTFFGLLTGSLTADMQANRPTPWMGVWERICIGSYLLWIIVLSLATLNKNMADSR